MKTPEITLRYTAVTIRTFDGSLETAKGYVTPDAPGLAAAHRGETRPQWTIVHLRTGFEVVRVSEDTAIDSLLELGRTGLDWTADIHTVTGERFAEAVADVWRLNGRNPAHMRASSDRAEHALSLEQSLDLTGLTSPSDLVVFA